MAKPTLQMTPPAYPPTPPNKPHKPQQRHNMSKHKYTKQKTKHNPIQPLYLRLWATKLTPTQRRKTIRTINKLIKILKPNKKQNKKPNRFF